jgi:hypothetical protein
VDPEEAGRKPTAGSASVMVFSPTLLLTVTLERGPDHRDDLHLHAGGDTHILEAPRIIIAPDRATVPSSRSTTGSSGT